MASNHLKNGMKDLQSYFPPNNNWSKKQMYNMISNLKKNDVRSIFSKDIREVFGNDYAETIKHPINLKSIEKKIRKNEYQNNNFLDDVNLMFSNFYIQFEKTSDIYIYVSEIQNLFNQSNNIQHEISNSTETFDQSNGNHYNVNNSTEFLDQSNGNHNNVNNSTEFLDQSNGNHNNVNNSTEFLDQSNGNHNNVNNSTEFLDQSNGNYNDVNNSTEISDQSNGNYNDVNNSTEISDQSNGNYNDFNNSTEISDQSNGNYNDFNNSTEISDQSNGNYNDFNNSTEISDQSNGNYNDVNNLNNSSPNSPINESENSLNNNSNEQTNDYFINDNDEISSDSVSDDNLANATVNQLNFSKTNFQIIRQKVDKYVYNDNVDAPKIYINPETYLTRIGQKKFSTKSFNVLRDNNALGYATTESNGCHVNYRCSVILSFKEKEYQCTVFKRANHLNELIDHVDHHFKIDTAKQTSLSFRKCNYTPSDKSNIQDKILDDLAMLVACESVPLKRAAGNIFHDLIIKAIILGQKNPNTDPNSLYSRVSTTKIRSRLIDLAFIFREKVTKQYQLFSHHGMAVDGGTVNSFHFLDVCLSITVLPPHMQNQNFINPYNFQTLLLANDDVETIQNKVITSVQDLLTQKINITSITSDNIPSQVLAFAPWSKQSFVRSNRFTDPSIKRIIHCSCSSHVINLLAKSIQLPEAPNFIKEIYSKFVQATDCLNIVNELGLEKPPKIIRTRWLLALNLLKYLRLHDIVFIGYSNMNYPSSKTTSFLLDDDIYSDPLGIDFNNHPQFSQLHKEFIKISHKKNININLFSPNNFRNYMIMGKVLWPLWQAILYFERDETSLISIYPILHEIENYWNELKMYFTSQKVKDQNILTQNDVKGWIECIDFLKQQLTFRQFHSMDWPLVSLAYVFTPAGRTEYRTILQQYGISILHDIDAEQMNSSEIEYHLFLNDFFGPDNSYLDEIGSQIGQDIDLNSENNDDNAGIRCSLYINDENTEQNPDNQNQNSNINESSIWFFPPNMMKQPSSILYSNTPWKTPNSNHSIDGRKLRYHHRPMTDIEFQLHPMHPNLIEATLYEVLQRLQYEENDIRNAIKAFKHWCITPIGIDGLNIHDIYNKHNVRNIWEKIRSNFIGSNTDSNPLCRGYVVLCDLAFTLISCLASEAQCERYISKQKLSLCINTRNINQDLLDAIWLMYSHRNYLEKHI